MNKTTCKIVGAVARLDKAVARFNARFNADVENDIWMDDDSYYKYCERELENLSDLVDGQVQELNAQLGFDAKENYLEWFPSYCKFMAEKEVA